MQEAIGFLLLLKADIDAVAPNSHFLRTTNVS